MSFSFVVSILFGFVSVIFVENRISKNKQIHVHYLCIILFALITFQEINTLLCVVLIYWFFRSFRNFKYHPAVPYVKQLLFLSLILLITGFFSVYSFISSRSDFLGLIVRNFVIMTFWPILIAYTIHDIAHLKKILYFYAAARIVEVSLTGLIIYFNYFKIFSFIELPPEIANSSRLTTDLPRLVSFGSPNADDASFVLLGTLGFISFQLFNKLRFIDVLFFVINFIGIIFTWTRSVWIFLIVYFVIVLTLNKKFNRYIFLALGLLMFFVFNYFFEDRKYSDNRLQSNDNAIYRKNQLIDYITAIPDLNLFYGMYEDRTSITSKLKIRGDSSAENYTLEVFILNGILAGCLFIAYFIYFIISFWRTTKVYIQFQKENKKDVVVVIATFATFVSLFLMAQSTLFYNNHILWILIGCMSVIKKQQNNASFYQYSGKFHGSNQPILNHS